MIFTGWCWSREEPRDSVFPSTSFGCVTGSITLSESYQMMWYEVSSSLWALLRSFISAGNCPSGSSYFLSLPFPSIGWAIRHVQSEASSTGQTEDDQQVKLLPSASLLPVPPGQHPLHVLYPSWVQRNSTSSLWDAQKICVCVCVCVCARSFRFL